MISRMCFNAKNSKSVFVCKSSHTDALAGDERRTASTEEQLVLKTADFPHRVSFILNDFGISRIKVVHRPGNRSRNQSLQNCWS